MLSCSFNLICDIRQRDGYYRNPGGRKAVGRIWRGSWSGSHPKSNLSLGGNMGGIAFNIISVKEGQRV